MCYKVKHVRSGCFQEGVGQFEVRFEGEAVVLCECFIVCRKLETFTYLTVQSAPIYVQSF